MRLPVLVRRLGGVLRRIAIALGIVGPLAFFMVLCTMMGLDMVPATVFDQVLVLAAAFAAGAVFWATCSPLLQKWWKKGR